jgi:hypothetical protein
MPEGGVMNWRWLAVALAFFLSIEVPLGFAAYGSKSWNHDRTEVLTGWPAVREVCLFYVPALFAAVLLGLGLIFLAVRWAMRGDE